MKIDVKPRNTDKSIYFSDGGYCFLKNDNFSVAIPIIDPAKKLKTGHIHLDVGSINVSYKGKPFIVDPGTYTYTRDLQTRLKYIDIHSHNIPVIKGEEAQGVEIPGYFNVRMDNRIKIIEFNGHSLRYKQTYFSVDITRAVFLKKDKVVITDEAGKEIRSYLHFHPAVKLLEKSEKGVYWFRVGANDITMSVGGKTQMLEYEYSGSYNIKEMATKLAIECGGYNVTEISIT